MFFWIKIKIPRIFDLPNRRIYDIMNYMETAFNSIIPLSFTNIQHTAESLKSVMPNMHSPDSLEITYVVSGVLHIQYYNDKDKKSLVQLTDGQFAIIKPNTLHKLSTPDRVHIIVFEIAGANRSYPIGDILQNSKFINSMPNYKELLKGDKDVAVYNDLSDVKKSMLKITKFLYNNYENERPTTFEAQFEIYVKQLFLEIYRSSPTLGIAKKYNKYIYSCLLLIKNNYDITVNAIAEKLGITVPYLSMLFKKEFGITLKKYICIKKIERAKYLLEQTDSTLTAIAKSLNYKTLRSFDIVFTKEVGVSPMTYRTNIKNEEFFLWFEKNNNTLKLGDKIEKFLFDKAKIPLSVENDTTE